MGRTWKLPVPTERVGEPGAQLRGVAIDGAGLGIAVWDVALPGRATVEIGEELSPGLWAARNPTAALAGEDSMPAVAAGADGAAVVTWVHASKPAGVVASERDAWGGWRDPAPGEMRSLEPIGLEPTVAVAPTGEWLLVWCQGHGRGIAIARRRATDAPWERPARAEDVVSPAILFGNQPQIAMNARGDALVAWYQSEGVPLMTYVSERRGPNGAFSHPGARDYVSAFGAPVDSDPVANPKPALGPRGEAAVVWVQENGAGAIPVYLATRDVAGAWTKPRDLGDAFSTPTGVARYARVAFGPGGELYVVWSQLDAMKRAVFAARRGADGVWIDPGRRPVQLSSPSHRADAAALAVGPEGGVIAAWFEAVGAHDGRIVARRTGGDRTGWEGAELLSGTGRVGPPMAAMGPGDRTLVGWTSGLVGSVVFARID